MPSIGSTMNVGVSGTRDGDGDRVAKLEAGADEAGT